MNELILFFGFSWQFLVPQLKASVHTYQLIRGRTYSRGPYELAALLGILLDKVGRDSRFAAYDSLMEALDATQSDSEVGIHNLA